MSNLPEYLRMRVNAAPNAKNVVTLGDVRITVITPRLIRIEQGTLTAIWANAGFPSPRMAPPPAFPPANCLCPTPPVCHWKP